MSMSVSFSLRTMGAGFEIETGADLNGAGVTKIEIDITSPMDQSRFR